MTQRDHAQGKRAETEKHYLNAIRARLLQLYAEHPEQPRLREQISDEIDWLVEKIENCSPVVTEPMRSSGPAEQHRDSRTWTAGIDVLRSYPYEDMQWHLHAIEFHHKVKEEAEALRDRAFAAWSPSPAANSTKRQSDT